MAAKVHQSTPRTESAEASSHVGNKSGRFYCKGCTKFFQHFSASDAAYKLFSALLIHCDEMV
jgi:hypothetical protein